MALARSTVCIGIFRSSSVSLAMLEAPAHSLEISPSEWLSAHVGQYCVQGTQPRLELEPCHQL